MIHLDLTSYIPPESESYRIEYWYNRHTRDWVVQVFDNNDIQQDSAYCPNRAWRDSVIAEWAEQYDTAEIAKV